MEECKSMSTPMSQKEKLCKKYGADKVDGNSDWVGPGSRSQAAKTYFSSGAFVTAIKNATHLVKGYWDRSLQPSLAWKVAREKKTILLSSIFNLPEKESTIILVDNQVVIAILNNSVFHKKTKHFNIKFYFLREVQQKGEMTLVYCKSENQLADLFTKPLPINKFELLRQNIGVCSIQSKEEC
ncbi:hypothetical protein KY285_012819 [Solanum tuberosum]|nr:hypothetical protein KY285_012819 [Solanum tuberosum]